MSIIGFLGDLISPVSKLIEKFTSDKERLEGQRALLQLEVQLSERISATKPASWRPRPRPLPPSPRARAGCSATGGPDHADLPALVVLDSLCWLPNRLAGKAWTLLQLGLGGYVVDRSLEKVAPRVTEALSERTSDGRSGFLPACRGTVAGRGLERPRCVRVSRPRSSTCGLLPQMRGPIPPARLAAVPGVGLCTACQAEKEAGV